MVNHDTVIYTEIILAKIFSFDYENCHFVIINSPNQFRGPREIKQANWLEADLKENRSKRIFLFSHYPLYVSNPKEPESYDNVDEPGRSWLINLIETYKPEALFTAHVHNFGTMLSAKRNIILYRLHVLFDRLFRNVSNRWR